MTASTNPARFLTTATRAVSALQGNAAKRKGTLVDGIECSALCNVQGRLNLIFFAAGDDRVEFMTAVAAIQNEIAPGSAVVEVTTCEDDEDLTEAETLVRVDLNTVAEQNGQA